MEVEAHVRQLQAEQRAELPFLGDDVFVLIAAELDARMLGRLGCAAQRFRRPSVPDPAHKGSAPAELWSVAEEGARRRLAAQSEQVRGWVSRSSSGGSWLRALGEAEKLQRPLRFTAHHGAVALSEGSSVATDTRRFHSSEAGLYSYRSAVCSEHEMRRGQHFATFTLRSAGPGGSALLGVVGPGLEQLPASGSPRGWVLYTSSGELVHAGRPSKWESQPSGTAKLQEGVVVRPPVAKFSLRLPRGCGSRCVLCRACCSTATRQH